MSSSKYITETYIFDPRPLFPLQLVAKRFFLPSVNSNINSTSNANSSTGGDATERTLLFAHGAGFHKELWEPIIDDLDAFVQYQGDGEGGAQGGQGGVEGRVKIREIWTVDCPNHGDSAAVNAEALQYGYGHIFPWEDYARLLHLFVNGRGRLRPFNTLDGQENSGIVPGVYPFDSGRKIVGIGHSMGAVALALSLAYTLPPSPSFTPSPSSNTLTLGPINALILIEPMILNPGASLGVSDVLVGAVTRRRDKWASRKEAGEVLGKSMRRQGWEGRCVGVFVEAGLRPQTEGEDGGPVTLKCAREHEAACYRDPIGPMRLYTGIRTLVDALPVHVMYGAVEDNALPVAMKREVVDKCSGGAHRFGSVNWVQGGGHLVPYQNPSGVARGIVDALAVTVGAVGAGAREVGKAKL